MKTVTVYTGAPEAADYKPHTRHLETFEAEQKTWRVVAITNSDYCIAYQCDRYRSFLGGCPTLDDPRTHPLGTGRPAPTGIRHEGEA